MAATPDYQSDSLARIMAVTRALAPDLDLTTSSVLQQWSAGIASSHADVKGSQDYLIKQSNLATATGDALAALALDHNAARSVASAAVQSVLFTAGAGAPGGSLTLPQGFSVSTQGSQSGVALLFDLLAPLTVPSPGSAVGQCQAEETGSQSNVVPGSITQFTDYPYLVSVVNQSIVTVGTDDETDTSLRGRALSANTVQGSNAAIVAAALAAGAVVASLVDPRDGSAHTTLYAGLADGTLPPSTLTAVQAAANAALPPGETITVQAFTLAVADLTAQVAVPSGYDAGLTLAAIRSASIAYANGLGAGQTMQPMPWSRYIYSQVPAMQAKGADFYPTSVIPAVSATQLFRFLAAPAAPVVTQATGGTIPLLSTVYVVVTWLTPSGETLPSVELAVPLTGANNAVVVTVPPAPNAVVTYANVYASATPGAEQMQGNIPVTVTAGGSRTINALATATGAVPPQTISTPTLTVTAL